MKLNAYLSVILSLALAVSCEREPARHIACECPDGLTLNVECSDFNNENRSQLSEDATKIVRDVNIFVYDQSGNLVNGGSGYSTFFSGVNPSFKASQIFPDYNATYDILICANMGQISASAMDTKAKGLQYKHTYGTYNDFAVNGFPMSKIYEDLCPATSSSTTLRVDRRVSRYIITVVNEMSHDFKLTSLQVHNSPRDIHPFQAQSKAEVSFSEQGDSFAPAEITGNTGVLYVMENYQGQVFPSGIEDKGRTLRNLIQYETIKDIVTYVEIKGKVSLDNGFYGNASYRYIFGANELAQVEKNMSNTFSLTITDACLDGEDGWRIDKGDLSHIWWQNAATTISNNGVIYSAEIVSSFDTQVHISASSLQGFTFGSDIESLSSSGEDIDLIAGEPVKVFYRYNGSQETVVNLDAATNDIYGEDDFQALEARNSVSTNVIKIFEFINVPTEIVPGHDYVIYLNCPNRIQGFDGEWWIPTGSSLVMKADGSVAGEYDPAARSTYLSSFTNNISFHISCSSVPDWSDPAYAEEPRELHISLDSEVGEHAELTVPVLSSASVNKYLKITFDPYPITGKGYYEITVKKNYGDDVHQIIESINEWSPYPEIPATNIREVRIDAYPYYSSNDEYIIPRHTYKEVNISGETLLDGFVFDASVGYTSTFNVSENNCDIRVIYYDAQ